MSSTWWEADAMSASHQGLPLLQRCPVPLRRRVECHQSHEECLMPGTHRSLTSPCPSHCHLLINRFARPPGTGPAPLTGMYPAVRLPASNNHDSHRRSGLGQAFRRVAREGIGRIIPGDASMYGTGPGASACRRAGGYSDPFPRLRVPRSRARCELARSHSPASLRSQVRRRPAIEQYGRGRVAWLSAPREVRWASKWSWKG
jgi:hypothetical protein